MSKEYRLAELHNFLNQQHNIQTMLLDNRLNYKDKIYIYLDKDTKQIKLEGFICPEYFAIRKLIYAHFGRIWTIYSSILSIFNNQVKINNEKSKNQNDNSL